MSENNVKIYNIRVRRLQDKRGELLDNQPLEVAQSLGFDENGFVAEFVAFKSRLGTYLRDSVTEVKSKPTTDKGVEFPGVSFSYRYVSSGD